MKRIGLFILCLMLILSGGIFSAAAEDLSLLLTEATTLTSAQGTFSYTEDGSLRVEAPTAEGATVAVDINQIVNLNAARYVHLSVEATTSFNVAFKMSNGSYDVYPQLAGPSWYEHFQESAPAVGEGVGAGQYNLVLDLNNYMEYNALDLGDDGYAYIRSVHVFVKGQGELTLKAFTISSNSSYVKDGQVVTASPAIEVITTAPHVTTETGASLADTAPTTAGTVSQPSDYAEGTSGTVIAVMVAAVVLIGVMIVLTVLKKRKNKV